MSHLTQTATSVISPKMAQEEMTRLLDAFVQQTPDVTHALLASTDGLKQVSCSHMSVDWTDGLAAALAGLAGLAASITGPTNLTAPVRQIMIERDDTLFLVTYAGTGSAFNSQHRTVATVLVILASTEANVGNVAWETGLLVSRFAPFMTTPVRSHDGQDNGVE